MGEGEYTVKVTVLVSAGASQVQLLNPNTLRVSVCFTIASGLGNVTVIPVGWPGGNPQFVIPTTGVLEFIYSHWGPLVAGRWDVIPPGGGTTIYATELLLLGR